MRIPSMGCVLAETCAGVMALCSRFREHLLRLANSLATVREPWGHIPRETQPIPQEVYSVIYRNDKAASRRFSVEVDRHGAFVRLGRAEVYARVDRYGPRSWGIFREPGAVEVEAGRLRVTLSRAP